MDLVPLVVVVDAVLVGEAVVGRLAKTWEFCVSQVDSDLPVSSYSLYGHLTLRIKISWVN